MKLAAIVLAGGKAERFGKDKLIELVDGHAVLAHVVSSVSRIADIVYLAARDDERCKVYKSVVANVNIACLNDPNVPCKGPAAPLIEAHRIPAEKYLVVAGDMPWIEPRVLSNMLAFHEYGATSIIHADGMIESLLQVIDRETVDRAAQALPAMCKLRGKLRPTDVLRFAPKLTLVGSALVTDSYTRLAHANTPVELRSRLARNRLGEKIIVELTPPLSKTISRVHANGDELLEEVCRALRAEMELYSMLKVRHLAIQAENDYLRMCRRG